MLGAVSGPNLLYYGDNLDVLRRHVRDESVDLVYLDPPFSSNANYNLLFEEHGEKAAAQVQAFSDTWEWNTEARAAYEEIVEAGGRTAEAMRAFRTMLGASDMLAYLSMMAPRLIELRRVLKPTGSLYLHCDPTASHYLKLLLDAVFGPQHFRSEVIWKRSSAHSSSRRWSPVHDTLLLYSEGDAYTWNPTHQPMPQSTLDAWYNNVEPATGRRFNRADLTAAGIRHGSSGSPWRGVDPTSKGRHWAIPRFVKDTVGDLDTPDALDALDAAGRIFWPKASGGIPMLKRYVEEARGVPPLDVIADIAPLNNATAERLGYPTQKPLALLERIVGVSSNLDEVVLDPFCGCGTTIDAAQALGRRWIGIDITHLSIGLIKHRLVGRYGPEIATTYRTIGEPTTVDDARVLAKEDPFQFQAWALGLVGARVAGSDKKGGDKGIDGRLYFHEGGSDTRQIVFSVKAGHLVPTFVRDLRGVIEREKAEIGVLLSFEEPTAGMRSEAAEAGFYESPWGTHPRIQLRTIRELLDGRGVDYPHMTGSNVTLRRAQRARAREAEALPLFGIEPTVEDS
jgi:DNA modification methylase